jgi:MYXO-CTERM domain-containing protein
MNPLLDRVANRYPDLPRDEALQRVGRQNLVHYASHKPVAFARMMAGKIGHMWHGAGDPSYTVAGSAYHYVVLALGLLGLALLALRRRWEVLPASASRQRARGCPPAIPGGSRCRVEPLGQSETKLIQYLSEAYATERELETALQAHVRMASSRASYKKRLQDHLKETKAQARNLERRDTRVVSGAAAGGRSDARQRARRRRRGPS